MYITSLSTWEGIKTNQNCKRDLLKDLFEQWGAFVEIQGQNLEFKVREVLHLGAMLPPALVIHPHVEKSRLCL